MRRLINYIHYERISELDWARLAAFIDGEGCITISARGGHLHHKKNQHMKVFIANTDMRLMNWLRNTFGGTVNGKRRQDRERHKPCYVWTVCSEIAWLVLLCCEPYFIVKRDQSKVALKFQRTMTRKRKWVDGDRSRLPQETQQFRDECYDELRRLKQRRFEPQPRIESSLTH